MNALLSLHGALERVFRGLVGLAFAVLVAAVTIQVIGRTFGASPVWTEELTRFALLYLAAFGTCLGLASGDLVDVDIVRSAMPPRAARAMRALALVLTAALAFGLVPAAWLYTRIGARQTSPALGWRMDWLHASVLVLLVALGVFALLGLVRLYAPGDGDRTAESGGGRIGPTGTGRGAGKGASAGGGAVADTGAGTTADTGAGTSAAGARAGAADERVVG